MALAIFAWLSDDRAPELHLPLAPRARRSGAARRSAGASPGLRPTRPHVGRRRREHRALVGENLRNERQTCNAVSARHVRRRHGLASD